jgi:hypothetical protein
MGKAARQAREKKAALTERDLHGWKLLEEFGDLLERAEAKVERGPREIHGLRQLHMQRYLRLFLLGVYNPVVSSMRALCQASHLPRVQKEIRGGPVALSRFSEAQAVFDPEVLRLAMEELVRRGAAQLQEMKGGRGLEPETLKIIDSTLWTVLPRMAWAEYGGGRGGKANAVRLHLKLRVSDVTPSDAAITVGKTCERQAMREELKKGEVLIGDRNYSENYELLEEMVAKGAGFLFRLRNNAALEWKQEEELSEADREAGLVQAGRARLGKRGTRPELRFVRIEPKNGEPVLLVASSHFEEMSAGQLAELYRRRWEVELFFRWLKCIVPCRHWFAESQRGVSFQIYLSLIYALMLTEWLGYRPSKRVMELIAWRESGWATDEDFIAGLAREAHAHQLRQARKNKKKA